MSVKIIRDRLNEADTMIDHLRETIVGLEQEIKKLKTELGAELSGHRVEVGGPSVSKMETVGVDVIVALPDFLESYWRSYNTVEFKDIGVVETRNDCVDELEAKCREITDDPDGHKWSRPYYATWSTKRHMSRTDAGYKEINSHLGYWWRPLYGMDFPPTGDNV